MKHGLAGHQGTGQAYHTGNLSQSEVRNASANNNFYANIGVILLLKIVTTPTMKVL